MHSDRLNPFLLGVFIKKKLEKIFEYLPHIKLLLDVSWTDTAKNETYISLTQVCVLFPRF